MSLADTSSSDHCPPEAFALRSAKVSQCPRYAWLPAAAPAIQALGSGLPFTLLNVGANKGFDLVTFLQWYTDTNLTKQTWLELAEDRSGLLTAGNATRCVDQCCGVCGSCRGKRPRGSPFVRPAWVQLHAFEVMPANSDLLSRLVRATRIPATVHRCAVGNGSTPVYVRQAPAGFEGTTPETTKGRGKKILVPQTKIDDFAAHSQLGFAHHVLIDAEGWDGLVLAGMANMLAAKSVGVLEFEYSSRWSKVHPAGDRALETTLTWLGQLGYTCFWHDNGGGLAEATPPCWRAGFEYVHPQSWRNLVCATHAPVVAVLRSAQDEVVQRTGREAKARAAKAKGGGGGKGKGGGGGKSGGGGAAKAKQLLQQTGGGNAKVALLKEAIKLQEASLAHLRASLAHLSPAQR